MAENTPDTNTGKHPQNYYRHKLHHLLFLGLLVIIATCVAMALALAIITYYKPIKTTRLYSLSSNAKPLIQPAPVKAVSKTPVVVPDKITTYNIGLQPNPGLQNIVDSYSSSMGDDPGIVVLDDTDGIYAANQADKLYTSASLYKLFVARELYDFRSQGKLSFDSTVTVTQDAIDQDNGDPNLTVGTEIQVSECLRRMIVISDNACGYLLGTLVGWTNTTFVIHDHGYDETNLTPINVTTANNVSLLLRRAAEGRMVDATASHDLEAVLFEQQLNSGLPSLLPPGVMGHKTGSLDGYVHDAGIVRTNNKLYIIVVMSGPWKSSVTANASIAKLSLDVYNYIMAYKP